MQNASFYNFEENIKHGNICEGTRKSITCGSNEVIYVKEAWYGRKSGTICRHPYMRDRACSTDPEKSLQIVKDLCDLKRVCTIKPTNRMFGDPCYNTYKYLSLSYGCQQGKHL